MSPPAIASSLMVAHRIDRRAPGVRAENWNPTAGGEYDRAVPHPAPLVDEIANELDSWPGVRIERRSRDFAVVRYQELELGVLDRDRGVAELPFLGVEHDELIESGEAEPAESTPESYGVSHRIHGPADVTAVLELFDRRYRDIRGADDAYSSQDSA